MPTTKTRAVAIYMYAPRAKASSNLFNHNDIQFHRSLGRIIYLVKDSFEFKKWDFKIYRIYDNGEWDAVSDKLIDKIASNRTLSMRYKKEDESRLVEPYSLSRDNVKKVAYELRERKIDPEKRETHRRPGQ